MVVASWLVASPMRSTPLPRLRMVGAARVPPRLAMVASRHSGPTVMDLPVTVTPLPRVSLAVSVARVLLSPKVREPEPRAVLLPTMSSPLAMTVEPVKPALAMGSDRLPSPPLARDPAPLIAPGRVSATPVGGDSLKVPAVRVIAPEKFTGVAKVALPEPSLVTAAAKTVPAPWNDQLSLLLMSILPALTLAGTLMLPPPVLPKVTLSA